MDLILPALARWIRSGPELATDFDVGTDDPRYAPSAPRVWIRHQPTLPVYELDRGEGLERLPRYPEVLTGEQPHPVHPVLSGLPGLVVHRCQLADGAEREDFLRTLEQHVLYMQGHLGWVLFTRVTLPLFYLMSRRYGYFPVENNAARGFPVSRAIYSSRPPLARHPFVPVGNDVDDIQAYFPLFETLAEGDPLKARRAPYAVLWYPPLERTLRFAGHFYSDPADVAALRTLISGARANPGTLPFDLEIQRRARPAGRPVGSYLPPVLLPDEEFDLLRMAWRRAPGVVSEPELRYYVFRLNTKNGRAEANDPFFFLLHYFVACGRTTERGILLIDEAVPVCWRAGMSWIFDVAATGVALPDAERPVSFDLVLAKGGKQVGRSAPVYFSRYEPFARFRPRFHVAGDARLTLWWQPRPNRSPLDEYDWRPTLSARAKDPSGAAFLGVPPVNLAAQATPGYHRDELREASRDPDLCLRNPLYSLPYYWSPVWAGEPRHPEQMVIRVPQPVEFDLPIYRDQGPERFEAGAATRPHQLGEAAFYAELQRWREQTRLPTSVLQGVRPLGADHDLDDAMELDDRPSSEEEEEDSDEAEGQDIR